MSDSEAKATGIFPFDKQKVINKLPKMTNQLIYFSSNWR